MARNFYTSWAKVPGATAQKKWATIQGFAMRNGGVADDLLRALLVYDKEALKIDPHTFSQTGDDHEVEVLLRAVYFNTVRRQGRGAPNDVRKFATFAEAQKDAQDDPRAIVYGVVNTVNSTALSRAHWKFYNLVIESMGLRGQ